MQDCIYPLCCRRGITSRLCGSLSFIFLCGEKTPKTLSCPLFLHFLLTREKDLCRITPVKTRRLPHVPPMWAYVHRDPMGGWQMARHYHTQMPTSYLSHLCQDKTHWSRHGIKQSGKQGREKHGGREERHTLIPQRKSVESAKFSIFMSGTDTVIIVSLLRSE